MLYMKVWKMSAQIRIGSPCKWLLTTYRFLCDVETAAYDLSKSVLVDAESLKYQPSITVAALVTVAIEINMHLLNNDHLKLSASLQGRPDAQNCQAQVDIKTLPVLDHIKICN